MKIFMYTHQVVVHDRLPPLRWGPLVEHVGFDASLDILWRIREARNIGGEVVFELLGSLIDAMSEFTCPSLVNDVAVLLPVCGSSHFYYGLVAARGNFQRHT